MPEGFKKWVDRNNDRIMKAKALPYFLRDNGRIVGGKWVLGKADGKPSGTVVKGYQGSAPSDRSGMFGRKNRETDIQLPHI